MPSITLKNVPQTLLERLRASAAASRRSVNSEVLFRLESSFARDWAAAPGAILARVDAIRNAKPDLPYLTDEMLGELKNSGRP